MILLDTHVLSWLQVDANRLSTKAAEAIREAQASGGIAISAITLVELASMIARAKLNPTGTVEETIRRLTDGVVVRPLTLEIAALMHQVPPEFPRDPMDRIIVATARAENLPLVTADGLLRSSPVVRTIW